MPSWVCPNNEEAQKQFVLRLEPRGRKMAGPIRSKVVNWLTTGDKPTSKVDELIARDMTLADAQMADQFLGTIIAALKRNRSAESEDQKVDIRQVIEKMDHDERCKDFKRRANRLFLLFGSNLLCIRMPKPSSTSLANQSAVDKALTDIPLVDPKTKGTALQAVNSYVAVQYTHGELYQRVVPKSQILKYLKAAHEDMSHIGADRMKSILHGHYWTGKDNDIVDYSRACSICAGRKGNMGRNLGLNRGRLKRGSKPFEIVYCDFVTMERAEGKKYILTILDSFTRYLIAVPCRNETAFEAARGLIDNLWHPFRRLPEVVSSDRGTHFTANMFAETMKLLNIKQDRHTAWRPQSSGNIERQHRTMRDSLAMVCHETNQPWTRVLQSVISNMNSLPNKTTKTSPHFLVFGEHPQIFPGTDPICIALPQATSHLAYGLQKMKTQRLAYQFVKGVQDEADRYYMRNNVKEPLEILRPGDIVKVKREQSAEAKRTGMPWVGEYTVIKTTSLTALLLDGNGEEDWFHRHHIVRVPRKPPHLIEIDDYDDDAQLCKAGQSKEKADNSIEGFS